MKKRIGNQEADCTSCRLCESKCPTEIKLDRLVRLNRYIEKKRGSHGSMFLTMGLLSSDSSWEYDEGETSEESDIVYFPGCTPLYDVAFKTVEEQPYGNYSAMGRERKYSQIGLAGLKLLNKIEIRPRMVTVCCGHDQYYAGMLDEVDVQSSRLKEAIGNAKMIVTPCAECRHMLVDVHGLPAVHISELLAERADDLQLKRTGLKVMYHDPCRLGRVSGIYDDPRDLISLAADLSEFSRNREEAVCCGVSSWINCNRVSKEQRERKIKEFEDSGADYLVVSCPKCAMHLDCLYFEEGEEGRERDGPNIIDFSELLAISAGIHSIEEMGEGHFRTRNKPEGPIVLEKVNKDPIDHIDDELTSDLFNCSTCFQCVEVCETGHLTPHLMEELRSFFISKEMNPEKHRKMLSSIDSTGNPFGEEEGYSQVKDDAEFIYFPGCTGVYRMKGIFDGTKKILEEMGVSYSIPEGLICCGSPLMRVGYDAEEVRTRNTELLDRKVLVSCAGCYAALANDYEGVEVEHIIELLARKAKEMALKPLNMKVAYHDPCHLGREFGIYDEPREVIKAIPGVELIEFSENRENSRCCGGGGGLRSWNPEKAAELARVRMSEAEEQGVDAVVSACPFCKLNLQAVTDIEVLDITELLVRSLQSE
ncbi:MAG: hypothetical protein GKC02_03090 [Methanomassiliicoccales archaeon]|nr:hypothetical protein [Methanomassiliicoccales archaeon]